MPSRRLLAATVLAAALATLTSCNSPSTKGAASPGPTASTVTATPAAAGSGASPSEPPSTSPATSPAGSPEGSPWASAAPTRDLPLDPEPSFDCPTGKLPAGHRIVMVTAPPANGVLPARATRFECDPNGGGRVGTGPTVRYRLAPGATAELNAGGPAFRTVPLVELARHINSCLYRVRVQAPFSCSGDFYDITLTGSGSVSHIREVWHP